jgi:uncharacterized SAM-binding protein YcdF (DUF218 family)
MFFLHLKTLLRTLVLVPAAPLLVAWFGFVMLRRRPTLARYCLGVGLGAVTLLSLPLVSHALTDVVTRYPALDLDRPSGAQAVVILGGGGQRAYAPEYRGPAAGAILLQRLEYGAFVAHRTALPVLVSGFHVEAHAMQASLERSFDLEPRWIDDQAYDTFENARNSAAMLKSAGVHRIILVTSAAHLWRASQEFEAAGLEVVPGPVGVDEHAANEPLSIVPDAEALVESRTALYEFLGEGVRWFFSVTHIRRQ